MFACKFPRDPDRLARTNRAPARHDGDRSQDRASAAALPYRLRPHRPLVAAAAAALALLLALVLAADRRSSTHVANVTAEATSSAGAKVSYAAPVIEEDNGRSVDSACSPASGSEFALGTTTVKCTATDPASGETRSVTFATNVVDTTPPLLAGVPSEIDVQAGPRGEASVTYGTPTASDAVDGAVPATCSPASGSTFGAGTTSVTCAAADSRGNSAGASFSVVVGSADTRQPRRRRPARRRPERRRLGRRRPPGRRPTRRRRQRRRRRATTATTATDGD